MGAKERLDLRLPAQPESIPGIRRGVMAFVVKRGGTDAHAIGLAVTEAATNVIVHAYRDAAPGEVRVVVCAEPDRFVIVVRDWGDGLRPRADSPGLGLGLPVIASLATEFRVEAADGQGTLLRMHFARGAAACAA